MTRTSHKLTQNPNKSVGSHRTESVSYDHGDDVGRAIRGIGSEGKIADRVSNRGIRRELDFRIEVAHVGKRLLQKTQWLSVSRRWYRVNLNAIDEEGLDRGKLVSNYEADKRGFLD